MNSIQLHDIALYNDLYQPCILLSVHSCSIQIFKLYVDESDYRRGKTSFEYVNVRC